MRSAGPRGEAFWGDWQSGWRTGVRFAPLDAYKHIMAIYYGEWRVPPTSSTKEIEAPVAKRLPPHPSALGNHPAPEER